jgi:hypothetical protein
VYCFTLQDWTTVRGSSAVLSFVSGENDWLDLGGFQDVVAWLEVKEFTPTSGTVLEILYDTSPTKDELLFANMLSPFAVAIGLTVTPLLKDTASVPLARWLRWHIVQSGPAAAWDITFRVLVAANRIGARTG